MIKNSHSGRGYLKLFTLRAGFILTLILGCSAFLFGLLLVGHKQGEAKPTGASDVSVHHSLAHLFISAAVSSELLGRSLYPYSVIPGGVESPQELRRAVERDAVVAGHYADFDLTKAKIIRLDRGRAAYVSYRIGERIYWTKRKLWLPAGETLITDGTAEARTRCGNRLSYVPQVPVSSLEPTEKEFEMALPPPVMDIRLSDLPSGLLPATLVSPVSDDLPFAPPNYAGEPPSNGPIFGGGGGGILPMRPGIGGGWDTTSPTPPVATPEPSTAVMLAFGLAALLFLKRKVARCLYNESVKFDG
jgi:hypothetical protein